MPKEKSAPTMKDVAQEAGVALGTVSKVINGLPVGRAYRVRVEKAIKKLDYKVNIYAQGMRRDCTHTVQVILPDLRSPFFAGLADSLSRELAQKGYKTLLCTTGGDPGMEQAQLLVARQHRVDGIICLLYGPRLYLPEKIPLVSIDRFFNAQVPCVSSDNYGGGHLAAEKLIENGCRNLAFLRAGSSLANEPNKRRDGFVSACEELGIPYAVKIIDDGSPFSEFEDFLREHFREGRFAFDGIFCVTDALAHRTRNFLESMGLRVPEDVQLIGFDGVRFFGDLELPCSTIVQPLQKIAKTCVSLVLEDPAANPPSLVCLPVSYACGGTTRQ